LRMTEETRLQNGPSASETADIDVGHHVFDRGNSFRLWCAREAQRQGEARIAGQMSSVGLMISRAVAALGWSVTLALALATASSVFQHKVQAVLPIALLLLAASLFLAVIWPRGWGVPGDDPGWIMGMPHETELEMVEALAARASLDCNSNAARLLRVSRCLRFGCLIMVLAVCVALAEVAGVSAPALGLGAWVAG